MGQQEFQAKASSRKFSANIIGCWSICLWKILACGGRVVVGADPYEVVEDFCLWEQFAKA